MSVSVHQLLSSRLVMVTGKGGTGKTSVASALAVLGANQGKRTVLCEIDNQRSSLQPIFQRPISFSPARVSLNLDVCNVDFDTALAAFIHNIVPIQTVVLKITKNKVIKKFLDFTPGSRELVLIAHLNTLVDTYDLVVVDMPASGHAFSMLDVIRSARGLFRSGPVLSLAKRLTSLLESQSARLVFVVLPEEMVVNETLETIEKMRKYRLIGGEPAVFLNKSVRVTSSMNEVVLLTQLSNMDLSDAAKEFVRAGLWEQRLESASALSNRRLKSVFHQEPIMIDATLGVLSARDTVRAITKDLAEKSGMRLLVTSWG